ncbi:MAG: Polysaccharide biosynthesis protein CapD [Candidatus Gallionella acididurans]|uniref:Polysaccharide biosynthesis protein CapD n=1 Tax=Candidatus Gallionella acididurans TaxID=1796491 RepID=A0A139BW79_9PROT|nr:MAG: Polysaccharide biosynthesis protein CapD [Candidatus Gallionella acididurans]
MLPKFKPNIRTALAVMHDAVAAVLAWSMAYLLRFNFELPHNFAAELQQTLYWVVPLQLVIFWQFDLYRGIWRYASTADLRRIFLAVMLSAATIPLMFWMLRLNLVIPRSVLIINPLLLILIMGGSRFVYRLWKEQGLYGSLKLQGEPVLVLGAGDAAANLAKDLIASSAWRLVGFLDDDKNKIGRMLHGIRVLGNLESLPERAKRHGVTQVIIAMPSSSHQQRKRAIQLCNDAQVKTLTVPSFDDLMSGKIAVSQLRAVELDDLLGRDPVVLDDAGLHGLLTGKVVMVTGAGGSIGSEMCHQVARFSPAKLLLFEASEFALYTIEQQLKLAFPALNIFSLIGDARDAARVDEVMQHYRPGVMFHAAAYKHVPLMEQHNAWQAIRNNVLGTWTVARAAQQHGVEKFVLISTDKAINPTNVMGASKRLAEMVCQALQPSGTMRFVMVRFGNVLGSTGSVIPTFRAQIARGGPVTVTHPEITRYFMSIPEAAQLVLQAGLMGQGGEIFVLEMGEPVKIVDLAKDLIHLSGFTEDEIKIEFTGLRPGEKLYEELLADNEDTLPTPHHKLRIAQARQADAAWLEQLLKWVSATVMEDDAVRAALKLWVPEYQPNPHVSIIDATVAQSTSAGTGLSKSSGQA